MCLQIYVYSLVIYHMFMDIHLFTCNLSHVYGHVYSLVICHMFTDICLFTCNLPHVYGHTFSYL